MGWAKLDAPSRDEMTAVFWVRMFLSILGTTGVVRTRASILQTREMRPRLDQVPFKVAQVELGPDRLARPEPGLRLLCGTSAQWPTLAS